MQSGRLQIQNLSLQSGRLQIQKLLLQSVRLQIQNLPLQSGHLLIKKQNKTKQTNKNHSLQSGRLEIKPTKQQTKTNNKQPRKTVTAQWMFAAQYLCTQRSVNVRLQRGTRRQRQRTGAA